VGRTAANLGRGAAILVVALLCVASALNRAAPSNPSASRVLADAGFGDVAASRQALLALQRADLRAAETFAKQSVSASPMRQQNLGILGTAMHARGDPMGAQAIFLAANQLGWRDALTQSYWFDWALKAGDVGQAAMRADALLRTGSMTDQILDILPLLDEAPGGRTVMATRLANDPPWSRAYIRRTASLDPDTLASRTFILNRASKAGFKADCVAVGETSRDLVARGMGNAAAGLWFPLCRPDQDARKGIIDGGFEQAQATPVTPFGWQLIRNGAVDVRVVDAPPPGTGKALYVESTSPLQEPVARQFTLLRPGSYRLTWGATGSGASGSGQVSVACLPSRTGLPQTKVIALGNNRFASDFSVPGEACGGQWITITTEAKSDADPASLYVDDLKIEPTGSKTAALNSPVVTN
jgi:hypothetical protein